jgi:hypothetical protein
MKYSLNLIGNKNLTLTEDEALLVMEKLGEGTTKWLNLGNCMVNVNQITSVMPMEEIERKIFLLEKPITPEEVVNRQKVLEKIREKLNWPK